LNFLYNNLFNNKETTVSEGNTLKVDNKVLKESLVESQFTVAVLIAIVVIMLIIKCLIIFRKNLMEECNGPPVEKFPEDHKIYDKNHHHHEDGEACDELHSPKSHFNKVYRTSKVIYEESPA